MTRPNPGAPTDADVTRNMPPILDGTDRGPCMRCDAETSTGLGFHGRGAWIAATARTLGLTPPVSVVVNAHGVETILTRICGTCVAAAGPGFPAPLDLSEGAPCLAQQGVKW